MQSLDRAFAILEAMADAGGIIGLSQLAEKADLPLATIHRLVRTLVDLGYVRQEASRQYSLGPRLDPLVRHRVEAAGGLDPPGDDRGGEQARRVGQPGHARRRRDRLRRTGPAVRELHADVHRGRSTHLAARDSGRQGDPRRACPTTTSSRCSSAPGCRSTPRRPWAPRGVPVRVGEGAQTRLCARRGGAGARCALCRRRRAPRRRSGWRSPCPDLCRGWGTTSYGLASQVLADARDRDRLRALPVPFD